MISGELDEEFRTSYDSLPISHIKKIKNLLARTLEAKRRLFWQSPKFPDPTLSTSKRHERVGSGIGDWELGARINIMSLKEVQKSG